MKLMMTQNLNFFSLKLHGDAAFAGQGINQEMLMMAGTPHFDVGGTIHMIVNNQIGFTTPAERGKISRYNSDLAKSILAPVFHVNGDDPEVKCVFQGQTVQVQLLVYLLLPFSESNSHYKAGIRLST